MSACFAVSFCLNYICIRVVFETFELRTSESERIGTYRDVSLRDAHRPPCVSGRHEGRVHNRPLLRKDKSSIAQVIRMLTDAEVEIVLKTAFSAAGRAWSVSGCCNALLGAGSSATALETTRAEAPRRC